LPTKLLNHDPHQYFITYFIPNSCLDLAENLSVTFQNVYKPLASFYAVKADQEGMGVVVLKIAGINSMTAETNIKALELNPDVAESKIDPKVHFIACGQLENRKYS
jgi:hypothetical protein